MRRFLNREDSLPIFAGFLAALAMPGFGLWPLAFVCLVPLFWAIRRGGGFRPGAWFALTFFLIDLRWLTTLTRFHIAVVPGYLILCVWFAVPIGAVGWIVARTTRNARSPWLLIAAPCWLVATEILRTQGPFGTGFSALCTSLYRAPVLIQSSALFGSWSISFAVVAVNAALFLALRERRTRYIGVAAGILVLMMGSSLAPRAPDETTLDVAVVSSTVRQETKLDGRNLEALRARYRELGEVAAATDPDLIVFPESFLPSFILRSDELLGDLQELARLGNAQVLFGTGEYLNGDLSNRVALLSSDGALVATYDMIRLVPFGEYIPGRSLLERVGLGAALRSVLPRDATPGTEFKPLDGLGTPICFESTFPTAARRFARAGADALVVVTNDAWFVRSSELVTHFAAAVFRAVETDRWVVQAANGGVSGLIDPRGRIVTSTPDEDVIVGRIGRRSSSTLYAKLGDAPLVIVTALGALSSVLAAAVRRRRGKGIGE